MHKEGEALNPEDQWHTYTLQWTGRDKRHCRSHSVIDFSCLATLPTLCSPTAWVFCFNSGGECKGGEKRGEVSKNKMPPLNHLPGSRVRSVIGKALIIRKVTALPEHPPPPFFCTPGSNRNHSSHRIPRTRPLDWVWGIGVLRFWSCQTDSISPVHNKRLRALMGPGHRDVACSRHRHCCISTNAIHLLADTLGFLLCR